MALDISALLTSGDDHAQTDHMFTSKTGDTVIVADVLNTMHCENHRLCAVPALASRFRNGTIYPAPYIRLTKAEYRVLVDATTGFGQSVPKTTKVRKLADLLTSSACVY